MAFSLTACFAVAAAWRVVLGLQEYVAGVRITDDPSARELREASALVELAVAFILSVHAAGAFVYTRREARLRWAPVVVVALMSSLCLIAALRGGIGGFYPVLMIAVMAIAGYACPRQWLSFYAGGVCGSAVAWAVAAPDRDFFIGLFVVVPSVVYVLIGTALGSLASRRAVP